jgi:hypothetical protein
MKYQPVHIPITTDDYRRISQAELKAHFDWFLASRLERISALKCAIEESGTHGDWKPDLSASSVGPAGTWFATQVGERMRTPEEMNALRQKSLPGIEISDQELTERTFSLAFDLGIYLGESLRSAYPHLEWKQLFDDKLFVDYGQPVLVGFGRVPLNPFRIVSNYAYGLVKKEQSAERLTELYLYWATRAAVGAKGVASHTE